MHPVAALAALAALWPISNPPPADPPPAPAPAADPVPPGLRCLVAAYPDHLCGATPTELVWCDGTRMAWDDGRDKADHAARLADADLEEQLSQPYPRGVWTPPPAVDADPGRLRHEPFFHKMYGATAAQVRRQTAPVRWLDGAAVRVTTVNRVHERLQAVSDELAGLPAALRQKVAKTAGTFNWRRIHGTARLSTHAFAIAIDVGVPLSDYWRWVKPDAEGRLPYRNRIPDEVVAVFERHGFIWGGKWYHFDTMHFEYRPELLGCTPPSLPPRP